MFQGNSKTKLVLGHAATLFVIVFWFGAENSIIRGQKIERNTGAVKPQPTIPTRPSTPRVRPPRVARPASSGAPRGSASEVSDNFLNLGDQFAEKSKWHAAAAAYKEALKLWSGNANALVALGFLYVEKGEKGEAYNVYNRLRSLDSSLAQDLMVEINKIK